MIITHRPYFRVYIGEESVPNLSLLQDVSKYVPAAAAITDFSSGVEDLTCL